jgi:hypothetical protein
MICMVCYRYIPKYMCIIIILRFGWVLTLLLDYLSIYLVYCNYYSYEMIGYSNFHRIFSWL